ncbi:hypothetical protein CAAN1_17S00298 [[Candida] anglica]|uniref:Uncharacterized protein n=1 Tax=[Candida] anglica TaxID=148631 RepID=A0ABP0EC30_9ASCO
MVDYISDSESDCEGSLLLEPRSISSNRVIRVLSRLPPQHREEVSRSLSRSGYTIEQDIDTTLESDGETSLSFSPTQPRVYNIDELFSDITYASQEIEEQEQERAAHLQSQQEAKSQSQSQVQRPTQSESNTQNVPVSEQVPESEERSQAEIEEETENANHLRAYLGGAHGHQSSRRGLRHRNFTNAHPYLADSAHWMGLASTQVLNDLYQENPDVEVIVKVLNHRYLQYKKAYPKEEKYKSKNFYAFLGKGRGQVESSTNQSQTHIESQERPYSDNDNDNENNNEIENDEDDDNIGSYDLSQINSDIEIGQNQNFSGESDEDLGSSEEESGDESETVVRVGGRLLKEKSVLRGALPESTKRLAIYNTPRTKIRSSKPKSVEYRRGLAVKKKSKKVSNEGIKSILNNFVDDNEYYLDDNEDEIIYQSTLVNESSTPERIEDVVSIDESDGDPDIPIINDIDDELTHDWEVIEEDRIDPMFAYSKAKRSSTGTNHKQQVKRKKTSNTNSIGNTKSGVSRRPTGAPRKRATKKRQSILFGRSRPSFSNFGLSTRHAPIRREETRSASHDQQHLPSNPIQLNRKIPIPRDETGQKLGKNVITAKEILQKDYHFSRNPVMSTTSVEGVSDKKYYHRENIKRDRRTISETRFMGLGRRLFNGEPNSKFPKGFILSTFDVDKLHTLKFGYSKLVQSDSVYFVLLGESFSFSLLDKGASLRTCSKALRLLSKIFHDRKLVDSSTLELELYTSIRGLIEWFLILQDMPDEASWKFLGNILNDFKRSQDIIQTRIFFYPYLLLLQLIFSQISESKNALEKSKKSKVLLYDHCISYFCLLMQNTDVHEIRQKSEHTADHTFTKSFESIHTVYLILSDENSTSSWWPVVTEATQSVVSHSSFNYSQHLDMLSFIASITPKKQYCWKSFYIVFSAISGERSSQGHDKFMDIVFHLKEVLLWPWEEKIITTIYSSITSRKFSNFSNEVDTPQLLGRLISRDSIPDTSFFERFMYLLFSFISELPLGANKKKLISKLFTSSHYRYRRDSRHFATYVNRFNFILLLFQLSDFDLRSQLSDLISQIEQSEDFDIYKVTSEGLRVYSDIAQERGKQLPVDSHATLLIQIASFYKKSKMPECYQLWRYLEDSVRMRFLSLSSVDGGSIVLSIANKIDMSVVDDLILLSINNLVRDALPLIRYNDQSGLDLILNFQEKTVSSLQVQMGRLPLLHIENEVKVDHVIESSLQLWIMCYSRKPKANWNELIFQRYPYIGNVYSRNKFNLFVYNELLSYIKLSEYFETYLVIFFQSLVPGVVSKYQSVIFETLRRSGDSVFNFKKEVIPALHVSNLQFTNSKVQILINLIQNVTQEERFSEQSKEYFIREYVLCLVKRLDSDSMGENLKIDFKKNVEVLQRQALKYVKDDQNFKTLTRRLGLSQIEVDKFAWLELTLSDKLKIVHTELTTIMAQENNSMTILDKYLSIEDFDLVFHLINIYMKAVAIQQHEKWVLIYELMKYLNIKLGTCCVNLTDGSLRDFFASMTDFGFLRTKSNDTEYTFYQTQALFMAVLVYTKGFYIYEGYKDQSHFKENVQNFITNYRDPINITSADDLTSPYSSLRYFDIQNPTTEARGYGKMTSTVDGVTESAIDDAIDHLHGLMKQPNFLQLQTSTAVLEFNL